MRLGEEDVDWLMPFVRQNFVVLDSTTLIRAISYRILHPIQPRRLSVAKKRVETKARRQISLRQSLSSALETLEGE